MKDTPPMIADGIVEMIAENFGIKERITANTAAIRITLGSYTWKVQVHRYSLRMLYWQDLQ